ncbi:hypothetical protein L227DRAFT_239328 [Lentinus tigrinus ALCF2SS1-6]|uniref:Secreted protein n=1 Tax=Lentinus tigrinus ALCF2SS1-6 TaxID=1328759 RepID=A0A5C2S167_9APHY|nr:hypothetical protein L227DRAFT_239328 [Lentinus tigrinus ALCF2SS1-6]
MICMEGRVRIKVPMSGVMFLVLELATLFNLSCSCPCSESLGHEMRQLSLLMSSSCDVQVQVYIQGDSPATCARTKCSNSTQRCLKVSSFEHVRLPFTREEHWCGRVCDTGLFPHPMESNSNSSGSATGHVSMVARTFQPVVSG